MPGTTSKYVRRRTKPERKPCAGVRHGKPCRYQGYLRIGENWYCRHCADKALTPPEPGTRAR